MQVLTPILSHAVRNSVRSGLPFALVRKSPGAPLQWFCAEHTGRSAGTSLPLFHIAPWGMQRRTVVIPALMSPQEAAGYNGPTQALPEPWGISTPREEYVAGLTSLIDDLRDTGGKTVISRTICGTADDLDIVAMADDCFAANPDACCCLLSTPQTGCWLIATPETLLATDAQAGTLRTMALAGTRKAGSHGPWDQKNRDEQNMVTDFILDHLQHLGYTPVASEPHTRHAGAVEHICTDITATMTTPEKALDTALSLSPTPAVCGTPRELSLTRIAATESHPRRLYGGFFAIEESDSSLHSFVTLRCAQLSQSGWCIYAGGGITPASDPVSEWEETANKASRMLNLVLRHSTITKQESVF